MSERTLILVKPDAMERGLAGAILGRFEQRRSCRHRRQSQTVDRELAELHYAEHAEKPFFGELVGFITTGSTLALVLEGEDAVQVTRTTIGATNPIDAPPAPSAATSRSRCRTTSSTARTRPRPRRGRSRFGSATSSSNYPEYVPGNIEIWTRSNAAHTGPKAREAWAREEIDWGVFAIPESEVQALGEVAGLDVVELGCGTAYVSAWLAKRGAHPVGVDPTPAQLATARGDATEFGLEFPLVEAV